MALILRGLSKAISELKQGVFLCDTQFDELFLLRLFVHMGGESEPKLKEKHPPTPFGWIKNGFSATSKLQKFGVFSFNIAFKGIYCT